MRKNICLILFLSFLFSLSYAGDEVELKKGGTIHKEIKLTFNESAIRSNEFLIFKINDDFDFKNLLLTFDGDELDKQTFRVYATQSNVSISIDISLREESKHGKYSFSCELDQSSILEENIDYHGIDKFTLVDIKYPKPAWTKFIVLSVIGLLVIIILWLIIKRSKTFKKGTIFISEPENENYMLKGKTVFNSAKEGCCIETGITFILKKGKNGNPKIVGKSNDTILFINDEIETTGKTIQSNYEVVLKKDDNQIKYTYI